MAALIRAQDVLRPHRLSVAVTAEEDIGTQNTTPLVLETYTGLITFNHGSGGDRSQLEVQCPLLDDGPPGPALRAYHNKSQIRRVAFSVALDDVVDKTDVEIASIDDLGVALREVTLNPVTTKIIVPVITLIVGGQNSEIHKVAYHVHILRNILDFPPSRDQIIVAQSGGAWDGSYKAIGPAL
jgi:hypothetical protein